MAEYFHLSPSNSLEKVVSNKLDFHCVTHNPKEQTSSFVG